MNDSSAFSPYSAPAWLYNGHLQTIIPSVFRKVSNVAYKRERINTNDKDFLDVDWLHSNSEKLVIITHGLEGDSHRPYIKGMARAFKNIGWNVLAWNFRGCSGEINDLIRFYHSGDTGDLQLIINYALSKKNFKSLVLVGFSLGGNITLKYLGEHASNLPMELIGAVTFSVPLHLQSSSARISKGTNLIYSTRFLRNLKRKVRAKNNHIPGQLSLEHFKKIKTLQDFDDFYTAPIHGFKDAVSYYTDSSALQFLEHISVPTLIVNAKNDPFLSDECFPEEQLLNHEFVRMEVPSEGGHCGFPDYHTEGLYWSERRAVAFAKAIELKS